MQRCFQGTMGLEDEGVVFSAHAEMFPKTKTHKGSCKGFLCTCRDVSGCCPLDWWVLQFSLHMQRCFYIGERLWKKEEVFSAHAEMFPGRPSSDTRRLCFLCTCRDVSLAAWAAAHIRMFSLHMQRCFPMYFLVSLTCSVFSAHAEMFLMGVRKVLRQDRFLCTCRDVSGSTLGVVQALLFSLHMQRCFYIRLYRKHPQTVFSAHAEMFPRHTHLHQ